MFISQYKKVLLLLQYVTFISYPDGESHSKRKIQPAATWMATRATMAQLVVSKGSRKAVGEMIPVFLATKMVIPVSKNGTEKSMTDSRPELIFNGFRPHFTVFWIFTMWHWHFHLARVILQASPRWTSIFVRPASVLQGFSWNVSSLADFQKHEKS